MQANLFTQMKLRGTPSLLLKVLAQADDIDWATGREYYWKLKDVLQALANHYGYSLSATVAAFVAMSPNNDYHKNLRSAATLMFWHRNKVSVDRITTTSYDACKLRAWEFLNGTDFLSVTQGLKTRAFYLNIMEPGVPANPVTIDGHMVNAWTGVVRPLEEVAEWGFDYAQAEADVRCATSGFSSSPQQIQAVIWLTWKRINGILAPTTLDLFGDHWQIVRSVDDLKPYPLQINK